MSMQRMYIVEVVIIIFKPKEAWQLNDQISLVRMLGSRNIERHAMLMLNRTIAFQDSAI
jgi:hypothetical protein